MKGAVTFLEISASPLPNLTENANMAIPLVLQILMPSEGASPLLESSPQEKLVQVGEESVR